ncbi:MAG: DNA methyltransferase [Gammaproteobacteria bacterium]|nr:DNA methyltransferase [Gammaproteobacteria bacterium]
MLGTGKVPEDWWSGIPKLTNQRERIGYPTQKPLALLQRIIQASSERGGLVLDPFCGCGTTIEAAHGLEREWIGIDICVKACQVIEERLRRSFELEWSDIEFKGMLKTRDHAAKLATVDPFQFERWAASLTPWMEWNKRPVADKGIDGEGRFPLRKGRFAKIVAQVKGGHTQPRDIQAFNGARRQARADMGVFTCFEDRVTQGMRDTAASTGRFMGAPVIHIFTVEDYFAGRLPQLPRAA